MDQIIIKYLSNTASEEEQQMLLNWIHESEANKKYFFESRDLWITTGNEIKEKSEPKKAFNQFKQHVLVYEGAKYKRSIRLQQLKYAASVALLICCSLGMYLLGNKNAESRKYEVIVNQLITAENKTDITLPDGTVVCLNNNSKLLYPDQFEDNNRTVKLEGEAFFEVMHNESAPFLVETGDMVVKVLGTKFDVRSYPDEAFTETILLSGKVEVNLTGNNETVVLSPHQKISIDKQTGKHIIENVDASEYTLWKNDRLVMDNEELGTIFRKIERWYNIDITYDNNIPLTSRYSITITDESKEEILRLLTIVAPIRYKTENGKITIKRK